MYRCPQRGCPVVARDLPALVAHVRAHREADADEVTAKDWRLSAIRLDRVHKWPKRIPPLTPDSRPESHGEPPATRPWDRSRGPRSAVSVELGGPDIRNRPGLLDRSGFVIPP